MYITTLICNNYIYTYTTKKNKMYSILFGLSILYGFSPIPMNFSFSFFFFFLSFFLPWFTFVGFSGFYDFVFFEKSLIVFCLDRFSIVVVVFVWIVFLFSFWSS